MDRSYVLLNRRGSGPAVHRLETINIHRVVRLHHNTLQICKVIPYLEAVQTVNLVHFMLRGFESLTLHSIALC